MDNREAYIILNMLSGIGPLRVNQLLTLFGEPVNILKAKEAELAQVPGIGDRYAQVIHHWQDHCNLDHEQKLISKAGVNVITKDDDEYPPLLREIVDSPMCLYIRGKCSILQSLQRSIALVGSRRTTHYGIKMAELLSTAAVAAQWIVVSGLARGIDTVSHEAVVKMRGCTVAVLGSGLGQIYPQQNLDLAHRIVETGGAVITELPMLFRPDKRTFPMRNRIISGMTQGTVVVEAGYRSGSLITAHQALDQNRLVFAVPGRADSPQSKGCHQLIKEGAKLVETFQDVLEEFASFPQLIYSQNKGASDRAASYAEEKTNPHCLPLSDLERRLLDLIKEDEVSIDSLIAELEEPSQKVLSCLIALEMRHIVRQLPGKRVTLV